MDKRVILAVAGSGKTHYICHSIDTSKRNLILAFTNENIHNIRTELLDAHGVIPENTTVMTFDSFVYRFLILPYEPTIADYFGVSFYDSNGITTQPPPSRSENNRPNPFYVKKDQLGHYLTKSKCYYCDNLSELVLQIKRGKESLIKRAASRINYFYDSVLIDEFQDFREFDYDLIIQLSKCLDNLTLVGDFYQHSVSGKNNSGKPFKAKSKDVTYSAFVDELKKQKFVVEETLLRSSRRCSEMICTYITQKLGINIESAGINQGQIIWVDDNNIEMILANPQILKLVFKESYQYKFVALNWSYSKGDTVDCACVILTNDFEKLNEQDFDPSGIASSTLNKLYVAMTRSQGDLYLIKPSLFRRYKHNYIISK